MSKKKLLVVYYSTPDNENIYNEDYNNFYIPLKNNPLWNTAGIAIESFFPPETNILYTELKTAIDESEEIYFHFSGHGDIDGISFDEWVLTNKNFAEIIGSPKVKFAFFSSCKSQGLLNSVKKKNIPVVIGTLGNINIENGYAITFQQEFYKLLAQGEKFIDAFNSACVKLEEFKHIKTERRVKRGELPYTRLGELSDNKLQILFNDEANEQNYLVYKTFVDRLPFWNDKKQYILVYSFDSAALNNFIKAFERSEWGQLNHEIIIPTELGLKQLLAHKKKYIKQRTYGNSSTYDIQDPDNFFQLVTSLKILFLIPHDVNKIFDNENIKEIFDDATILKDCDFFKYGVALAKGVNEKEIFNNTTNFQHQSVTLLPYPKEANGIDQLIYDNKFDQFINKFPVDYVGRKVQILSFPCEYRDKIYQVEDPKLYIRSFIAPAANQDLVHFLINWLQYQTPIIICDDMFESGMTIKENLERTILKTYKNDKSYIDNTLEGFLSTFVKGGHLMVFRTNYSIDNIEKLKTEIAEVLAIFDSSRGFYRVPPTSSYLFFMNEVSFELEKKEAYNITISEIFSSPKPVDNKTFTLWANQVKNYPGKALAPIIDSLKKINLTDLENKCPSHLIEIICEEFRVPRGQILNI